MSTNTKSLSLANKSRFPSSKYTRFVAEFDAATSLSFPIKKFPIFFLHQHQPTKFHQVPKSQNHPNNPPPDQLRDTQEAISLFLQEFGVSLEESNSIAFTSSQYANMLLDSVKDLDDWNSWNNGGPKDGIGGFKEKVLYMAKQKGDNGKVAFLESVVGLSLSSAFGVARYISREPLPTLIHKVNYVKEMFFSGSDDKGFIGKHARRMMMHLSITIDEDLQRTLSLFEKMEARRGGLDMLGSSDASFRYVVESFPRILLLPIDSHLKPVVEFLESVGVPKDRIGRIFLLFPPIIFWDIRQIRREVMTFEKVFDVDKVFGKMLLKYPWLLSASIRDNYKDVLAFFDAEKVPKLSIGKAIRSWPHLLGCSTSELNVMVKLFSDLGFGNKILGQVIAKSPQLLLKKPQEFLQVVSFLEDLGFDQKTVGKILSRCPEIFAASIEKTLKKKVEFLTCIGISRDHFPRVIKKYPELLVSDVNETLLPRMKYLMEIGISKKDIAFMVRRFSPLLGYSIDEVLRPKYEFLVNTMEKPVKDVVDYPRYFSYSLEKKIKPRFWVLKGRNVECSLKDMLDKNDEEFAAKFMDMEPPIPVSQV